MIHRATLENIDHVNHCLNRDFPGGDLTEVLSEPLHIILMEGDSGAVFAWRGPETYELHLFFDAHGREAIDLLQRMFEVIHNEYGGRRFWALVPDGSRQVKFFARWMGWKSQGRLTNRHGLHELFVSEMCECHL